MSDDPIHRLHRRAFTLVEMLIVMVILSILGVIVISQVQDFQREAEQTAFAADLRTLVDAATLYAAETGEPVADAASGQVPAGFEEYIDVRKWRSRTPIGGLWDTTLHQFGISSGLGVDYSRERPDQRRDDNYLREIDAVYDNGDLESGRLRLLTPDRFFYVIHGP